MNTHKASREKEENIVIRNSRKDRHSGDRNGGSQIDRIEELYVGPLIMDITTGFVRGKISLIMRTVPANVNTVGQRESTVIT